jgi:hypothetical protein
VIIANDLVQTEMILFPLLYVSFSEVIGVNQHLRGFLMIWNFLKQAANYNQIQRSLKLLQSYFLLSHFHLTSYLMKRTKYRKSNYQPFSVAHPPGV